MFIDKPKNAFEKVESKKAVQKKIASLREFLTLYPDKSPKFIPKEEWQSAFDTTYPASVLGKLRASGLSASLQDNGVEVSLRKNPSNPSNPSENPSDLGPNSIEIPSKSSGFDQNEKEEDPPKSPRDRDSIKFGKEEQGKYFISLYEEASIHEVIIPLDQFESRFKTTNILSVINKVKILGLKASPYIPPESNSIEGVKVNKKILRNPPDLGENPKEEDSRLTLAKELLASDPSGQVIFPTNNLQRDVYYFRYNNIYTSRVGGILRISYNPINPSNSEEKKTKSVTQKESIFIPHQLEEAIQYELPTTYETSSPEEAQILCSAIKRKFGALLLLKLSKRGKLIILDHKSSLIIKFPGSYPLETIKSWAITLAGQIGPGSACTAYNKAIREFHPTEKEVSLYEFRSLSNPSEDLNLALLHEEKTPSNPSENPLENPPDFEEKEYNFSDPLKSGSFGRHSSKSLRDPEEDPPNPSNPPDSEEIPPGFSNEVRKKKES